MNLDQGPLAVPPRKLHRIGVAILAGFFGASLAFAKHLHFPDHPGDFAQVWFSAQAILNDANPYALVGPGRVFDWPWHLYYPGTAMVAAIPFTLLPQLAAVLLFVGISSALLAYAVTADGWYRLPLFVSASFVSAAGSAQWASLFTAALLIPALALAYAAKPNIGLALAVGGGDAVARYALIGGLILTAISLALSPTWPIDWLNSVKTATHMGAPITRWGGPFIVLVLLRWRRPEARLVFALACMRQTTYWYEALPLFLVPMTLGQTVYFGLFLSTGMLFEQYVIDPATELEYNRQIGSLMVALGYLPATLMILRRPNEGELPAWLVRLHRIGLRKMKGLQPTPER